MYSSDFVVAIIQNGEFSKESIDGIVPIPFGCEYTIRLRNKNNRRAVATVFIDGENVTAGGIVVNQRSYVDLERSVEKAVKFKFVSAESGEAVDAGKNNRQDGGNGVIRVEWKLERQYTPPVYALNSPWRSPPTFGGILKSLDSGEAVGFCETPTSRKLSEGCTVEGGQSNQSFTYTQFVTEQGAPVVIQLKLQGYTAEQAIPFIKYCSNCGAAPRSNKDKFCTQCGRKF